jgi:2-dehydropantoate 2-reductase
MTRERPIAIAGAGSIGCFVGGLLAAAGRDVAILARPRVIEEITANGLRLTGFDGLDRAVATSQFRFSEDPAILNDAGLVLVTVKSVDSADIAHLIAGHAPSETIIVSLQNGVGNTAMLRERLPGRRVLGGMVPFNVVAAGYGRLHRATSGDIVIEQDDATIREQLSVPGLKLRVTSDIAGVQWGKLLVNLNNGLNALSGLTLQEQLAQRRGVCCLPTRWRKVLLRSRPSASGRCRRR